MDTYNQAHLTAIVYYITGHGFGHTVRSVQVIRALKQARPELSVYVRSTAPQWLMQRPLFQIHYSRQRLDVGIVQRDSLEMDLAKTLTALQRLQADRSKLVERELDFIRQHRIQMVLGDIPPLCFDIARQASLPSVAVGNFTWSWIYRAYLEAYPAFLPLIKEMESAYCMSTLALTLPYSGGMEIFPRRKPVPWVCRISLLDKEEARRSLGLPLVGTIVLISFGGLGLSRLPWSKLERYTGFVFVGTGRDKTQAQNVFILPDTQPRYEDLVRAADLIVTKPGYGIVADAIAHRVPVLYTERGAFPEYPHLVQALNECASAEFVPQAQLLAGDFLPYLERLLNKKPNWPDIPLDGAKVAAQKILALLAQAHQDTK